jgi:hypothetical protein
MKYNNTNIIKQRWQLPPPEEVTTEPMAFTININDDSSTLTVWPRYQALLQKLSVHCDLDMYFEYSSKFKLHTHGWLKVKTIHDILPLYAILNDSKVKNTFTYCLKILFHQNDKDSLSTPHDDWQQYITKQAHISKKYLNKMNLSYRTQISDKHPIGEIYKYMSSHDELTASLDETI